MDIYYAIIDDRIVGMTWASSEQQALDRLDLALAENDIFDTERLDVRRFGRNDYTLILDLDDQ